MPSITFQDWEDRIVVTVTRGVIAIAALEAGSEKSAVALCTPREARKLATMLNEIADRVEDDS